jgi:ClpP class serine protease
MVPHYAMSGGTLIALAADEIIMDANAVLGPVDPQIGEYPAASILRAAHIENPNRDDRTLILADIAEKALKQVYDTVYRLVLDKLPEERAEALSRLLTQGTWTHDYPIDVEEVRQLGLPVSTDLPREVYQLMALYPQPAQRRPSVEYVPMPYHPLPPAPSSPQAPPPTAPQPGSRRRA